jgi:putative endonuclease
MYPYSRKEAGEAGERIALAHLQSQGLELVERNYRCRGGEIDLIMWERKTLVLVEVRMRSGEAFGGAAASVDARKQKSIILASRHLMMMRPQLLRACARFDVVALDDTSGRPETIHWLKDAFRLA